MTGQPVHRIDVVLGYGPDGLPKVNVDGIKYRAIPLPVRDPDVIRGLIVDLHLALAHLESGPKR
ncbi:hypothetical protein GMYAFLOJ_CDS0049 [Microbacterium phage phiMiGM15]